MGNLVFEDEAVNTMINDMEVFAFAKEGFHNRPAYCLEINSESVSPKNKYILIELASVFNHYLSDFIKLIKIKITFPTKNL